MRPSRQILLVSLAVLLAVHAGNCPALTTNFLASFETAGGSSDATATVLNSGTAVGYWTFANLQAGASGVGALSANAANRAAVFAHNNSTLAGMQFQLRANSVSTNAGGFPQTVTNDAGGGTLVFANFATPGAFTGTNETRVRFKWGTFGTAAPANMKYSWVRGLDAADNEVFELLLVAGSTEATRKVFVRGPGDNATVIHGTAASPQGIEVVSSVNSQMDSATVNTDPAQYLQVEVVLTNGLARFTFTHSSITGSPVTTANFPINSSATTIAKLEFSQSWASPVNSQPKGFWLDDLVVFGSAVSSDNGAQPAMLGWSRTDSTLLLNSVRRRDFNAAYRMQSAPTPGGPWTAASSSEVVLGEDDANWMVQTAAPILPGSAFFRLQTTPPAPGARVPQPPQLIEGVKWKNEGPSDAATSVRFETRGLSYAQGAANLHSNGIHTVVLKVGELKIFPSGTTIAQRDAEVIALLQALKGHHPTVRVYLWTRRWMQRSGSYQSGAEEVASEFSSLINQAKAAGVDDILEGVCPIETNLETSYQTLERALFTVQRINTYTGGWLTNKTFFMPGAGMGAYFVGIHNAYPGFFHQMSSGVKHFAFIFKFYKSQDVDVCSLGALNDAWIANFGNGSTTNVDQRVAWLRSTDGMGVADLETFINANRAAYPRLANVIYWGDSGDGMDVMTRQSIQACHRLLVQSNGWTGAFFNMAYGAIQDAGQGRTRFCLQVDTNTLGVVKNFTQNDKNTMTVWEEWRRWNWIQPNY